MTENSRLLKGATIFLIAAGFAIAGCGDDDDDDGSSGGSGALNSCNQVCTAQETGACLGLFSTAAQCQEFCGALIPPLDANCQSALQASADCQLAQPNICDTAALSTACQSEMEAADNCMAGG